ncbi:urease accessory protein UreE [Bacillus alkalicellulosilyticus]|uniref:urease accessory protein UreE n=1 Tax=Alkalihalobacterium alkalicellulosilyticum TaxID=1912214 RepID=UPI000998B02F|nr:urease accessory protein UreE [Bacillus alkalicellulosilyticus]
MLIHKLIGNVKDSAVNEETIEWLELDWEELNKRILRKNTDKGREIALALEDNQSLEVGSILYQEGDVTIAVRTIKEPAFVATPKSMREMGKMAFELGNRHTPCLITDETITVRFDATLEPLFKEVGIAYEKTETRFETPFKYKGHHHH